MMDAKQNYLRPKTKGTGNSVDDISSSKESLQTLQLNTNKAGMEGLDTGKINEIIQKASEGSKFFQHKQKSQEKIDARIAQMKAMMQKFTEEQILKADHEMSVLAKHMEYDRDFTHTIVHIDMDMFYAAVEMRDDPSLKEKPMAVGGNNMLSTSNYLARRYGVRAAMPGFIAKKLCPELIIVPTNFDKYKKVSREIQEIFKEYDPDFCPMSLDEAYLDISDYLIMHSRDHETAAERSFAEAVVEEIRKKIEDKTSLTASAGIAVNTRLAKVCSDMNKPNGQFYLPPCKEEIERFVKELPIRKISGIGNVTEQQLKSLGIVTCGDIWKQRGLLKLLFSETSYTYFLNIALGLGSAEVSPSSERDRKSISNETTFAGTSDRKALMLYCTELCKDLAEDMAKRNLFGKVFTLKMKTTNFEVRTRAQSLLEPIQDELVMTSVAHKLLINEIENETKCRPLSLRLLGVRMSNLVDKSHLEHKKQVTITQLFSKSSPIKKTSEKSYDKNVYEPSLQNRKDAWVTKAIISQNSDISSSSSTQCKDSLTEEFAFCSDLSHVKSELSSHSESKESLECDIVVVASGVGSNMVELSCPVCNKISFNNVGDLNIHIDLCLNEGLVKELTKELSSFPVKETSFRQDSGSKSEVSFKRKNNNSSAVSKRHKTNNTASNSGAANVMHKFLGLQ